LDEPLYIIQEQSWIARIAAWKLKSDTVAIVVGRTIHLWNSSRAAFLSNQRWLKHELCHIRQYERYGTVRFIVLYLWESWRHGYYNNRFEVEARKAELE